MEIKKKLYEEMLRLRIVEERIAGMYHIGNEMKCPTHLYTGQEAVAVGACSSLRTDDVVCPYHRSHGWYLAKGGDLNAMMAEIFGKETGCSKGWGGSMHLIDVVQGVMGVSSILGGTVPHAVGCAFAFTLRKTDQVAFATFGDAMIEEGVFHESLNWASLKQLPVVFICENNLYSTMTPLEYRQPSVDIYRRAESYGCTGIRVDGNDVLSVREVVAEAVQKAREGRGPTLVEAMTYRWREHVGPNYDYEMGFRSKDEVDDWMKRCPIKRMSQVVSREEDESMRERINKEFDDAIEFARRSPFPTEKVLYEEI